MYLKIKKMLNQKGFSLIELMVVVAIIGILAAIGIPQYSKFQAKTRQSEAKGSLATLYTAEVSFAGEWNQYSTDLRNIGFGVAGTRLRYITGFATGAGTTTMSCAGYTTSGGAPAEGGTISTTLSCGALVNVANSTQAQNWNLPNTVTLATHQCTAVAATGLSTNVAATTASCDAGVGTQAFVAGAWGDPNANVQTFFLDGWTINQLKSLTNSSPGIR